MYSVTAGQMLKSSAVWVCVCFSDWTWAASRCQGRTCFRVCWRHRSPTEDCSDVLMLHRASSDAVLRSKKCQGCPRPHLVDVTCPQFHASGCLLLSAGVPHDVGGGCDHRWWEKKSINMKGIPKQQRTGGCSGRTFTFTSSLSYIIRECFHYCISENKHLMPNS